VVGAQKLGKDVVYELGYTLVVRNSLVLVNILRMGRCKKHAAKFRRIMKFAGKSYGLTLPKEMVSELGWTEKMTVEVTKYGKKLIIKQSLDDKPMV
jgi:Na+-transporting NADH:ubiquinone oxidoreductase subunit NqrD